MRAVTRGTANRIAIAAAIAGAAAAAASLGSASAAGSPTLHEARYHTTWLISRNRRGGIPNGPSTHAVISGDKRYARLIAFQSSASDLVAHDTNRTVDVFAIRRTGHFTNNGEPWRAGRTILISRGLHGKPANGPSYAPAVDGNYYVAPRCVAFLSGASNLVRHDTNGRVDAFLWRDGHIRRISYPGGHQGDADTTAVAVAGDCSRTAFVTGGRLFVRRAARTRTLHVPGPVENPAFGAGEHSDLVFDARGAVFLSRDALGRPHVVAHGRNPAFNAIRRQVVAYEVQRGGHWQIAYRDLGQGEHIVTRYGHHLGNGDSHDPVVVNSGYYIGFDTQASNLGTIADRRRLDHNGDIDSYLYTGVRQMTLLQSVGADYGRPVPGGGRNPSVSFYSNYFLFDSPAPLGSRRGARQVFMRYLGGK